MKAACKYVEVLLAFADYQQHSLGGLTVVSHRQECIQTDVARTTQTWSQVCQVRVVRPLKSYCVTAEHVDTPNLS